MSFTAAISQKLRGSWKRAAGAALTTVMLSAVAVVGLALLGSDVLASWKAPENAEQAFASSQGLLTFEAPASTLLRFQAKEKDAQNGKDGVDATALLVTDWKDTSLTLAQFQQLQRELILFEIWVDITLQQNGLDAQNLADFIIFEFFFNQQFALLAPPASPSS